MSLRALICVVVLICLNAGFLSAQIPTLDASQTVNPATGEMGFSLPLGTVQGISKGFPINLYYNAGIQLDEEASPAGLGFSYAPGTITRKTVFVPDDAHGGNGYYFKPHNEVEGDPPPWRKIVNVILTIAATVLTIILFAVGGPSAAAGPALIAAIWIVGGVQIAFNMIPLAPGDFIAGGEHVESYKGTEGTGFLRGATDDIPDIFFVNTPFISGQFSWEGDLTNGRFLWKNSAGSSEKDYETVKIIRKTDSKGYLLFEIVLNDGTRLIFDKYNKTPHFEEVWNMSLSDDINVCGKAITHTYESMPECWHLTKILYSDYVDGGGNGDDPIDSRATNKGEWVAFEYDSIAKPKIFKAFRMSQMLGRTTLHSLVGRINNTHKYPDGHSPLEPITLSWLKKIHTPVDSAVFNYTMDRKDDLWFDATNNNAIVPMPVLRSICFKNKDGSEKLSYTFNTGYDLRPNSFNAFKQSWDLRGTDDKMLWPFTVARQSGNSEAKSLALRSISVTSAGKSLPPIMFSYDQNTNFEAYNIVNGLIDTNEFSMDFGCDVHEFPEYRLYERHWYIEQKDYWGYFLRNTTHTNNFNPYGESSVACIPGTDIPYASAWSLKKVRMPSGMTIEWDYELNRYQYANGVQLTDGAHNPLVQYGGGIRVRSVKIGDVANSKNKTISYFYTQTPTVGNFEETPTNSCGHATALPYPYLLDRRDDKRPWAARGGLYTAAKIAYEQCIVAANYDWENHRAPNGYTVNKFITSKDFPNTGIFGMTDYSWKRGMLDTIEVYNGSNKLLSRNVSEYEYHEQDHILPLMPFNSDHTKTLLENTTGWVKLKKTEKTINGVTSSNTLLYANDLSVESVDKNNLPQKKLQIFDANELIKSMSGNLISTSRVVACKTNTFGEPEIDDIAIVRTDGFTGSNNTNIYLCLGIDAKEGLLWGNSGSWSEWCTYVPDNRVPVNTSYYVLGAKFLKMDDNDNDDLVVVVANGEELTEQYFFIYVFHDISITGGLLTFHDNLNYPGRPSITKVLGDPDVRPVGCVIDYLHGNTVKPDLLIINNSNYLYGYPGDLLPNTPDHPNNEKRTLSAIMDIVEQHIDNPFYATTLYKMDQSNGLPFNGFYGFVKALDSDDNKNDLIITGPGLRVIPNGYDLARPITYQIFKDVSYHDGDHTITWSCENCTSNYELFTMKPYCGGYLPTSGHNWEEFTFGGLFQDDGSDQMQFLFPEWSANKFHFNILTYQAVPFNGDYDGAANRSYTSNSNKTILMSTSIPAYAQEHYEEMGDPRTFDNKHMLSQLCGTVTYSLPASTSTDVLNGDLSGHAYQVVAAKAATWLKFNNESWLPSANYVWKVPMNSSGLPVTSFIPFNYSTPSANDASWNLTDSICKYTLNHLPKEIAKPNSKGGRVKSSIIYGHKGSITTGTVTNAGFEECGVFTGDYRIDNVTGYWDYENGWEKGADSKVYLNNGVPSAHFGMMDIRVAGDIAAARNCRIYPGKEYVMSAWVRAASGTVRMSADFRYCTNAADTLSWPTLPSLVTDAGVSAINKTATGDEWKLLTLNIPSTTTTLLASRQPGKPWYAHVKIWNTDGSVAFIDDIRFSPKNALVTSTYYDHRWFLPILSIDANNNPGNKVIFDDFGRPIETRKFDKTNPLSSTLLKKFEYNVRDQLPEGKDIQLLYPDFGGDFDVQDKIDIQWVNRNSGDVHIYFVNYIGADSTVTEIKHAIFSAGFNERNWTIPDEAYGINKIMVTIGTDGDLSDAPFTVKIPPPHIGDDKSIYVDATWPITWYLRNTTAHVKIEYTLDGGSTWIVLTSSTENDLVFNWSLPSTFTLSSSCKLRITDVDNAAIVSESRHVFEIRKRSSFLKRFILDLLNP